MKLEASADIPFPRERVFAVYRDRLADLVPFLPNVRGVQPISRTDDGAITTLVNHWKGGADIPPMARAFLSEKLLEWDDFATWNAADFTCRWRTEVGAFKEAVRASGVNTFEALDATRTRLTIVGDISVDATRIKGVPRIMAGTVGPAAERVLVSTIRPNLLSVATGLTKFLQQGG